VAQIIQNVDCIDGLAALEAESVDLIFADPPFNIGYEYDSIDDRMTPEKYLAWSEEWLLACHRVLKSAGTLWVASGDEYAAELKVLATKYYWHRSWVIWYYTFGVNCARNFSRSHTHLFYLTRDSTEFTFNSEDIRVPSARQLMGDSRADPRGRLPDNTWVLRPNDAELAFAPCDDVWSFSRVCGTFNERAGFHGCQMPEALLERIIRVCSNPCDLVLDPFAGSGSTLMAAKKLGRRILGFDISAEYVAKANARLAEVPDVTGAPGPSDCE